MSFSIELTISAERDLADIFDWIAANDSTANALSVVQQIEAAVLSLGELPERGNIPNELQSVGIKRYREIFFKPYRVIYRVIGNRVVVFLIVDGRRDMRSLLIRRLLGG